MADATRQSPLPNSSAKHQINELVSAAEKAHITAEPNNPGSMSDVASLQQANMASMNVAYMSNAMMSAPNQAGYLHFQTQGDGGQQGGPTTMPSTFGPTVLQTPNGQVAAHSQPPMGFSYPQYSHAMAYGMRTPQWDQGNGSRPQPNLSYHTSPVSNAPSPPGSAAGVHPVPSPIPPPYYPPSQMMTPIHSPWMNPSPYGMSPAMGPMFPPSSGPPQHFDYISAAQRGLLRPNGPPVPIPMGGHRWGDVDVSGGDRVGAR
jgi:hypothetical protein